MVGNIRYRLVFKYIGGVLLILGGGLLLSGIFSLILEDAADFLIYALLSVFSMIVGIYLYLRVPEKDITKPEAVTIGSISFLIASLVGAIPYIIIDGTPTVDAWFEAMSGFTTTGFSLIKVSSTSSSLLFWRALSQWFGGVGFVIMTISFFLVSGVPGISLLPDESGEEKLFPRIVRHAQVIVITYFAISLLWIIMLSISGLTLFQSICYTLSGISTGGFSIHLNSFGDIPNSGPRLAIIVLMLIGGTNFLLYYRVLKAHKTLAARLKGVIFNPQVLYLIISALTLGGLLTIIGIGRNSWSDGLFMAVSAQTTTGYATTSLVRLHPIGKMLIIMAMLIGGGMGSTAGGIKIFRIMALFKNLHLYILRQHYPKEVVLPSRFMGRAFAMENLAGIVYVITTYLVFIFLGSLIFIAHGYNPLNSLFEVTSAAGTVGLSSGIVSPDLPLDLKFILIFLMWAGRLEFMAIMVWLYSFILKRR